ncbi:C40 family peptidase [Kangiella sp. TOML190]|uniref:C40 family peptidase n=1 Tax=Kangiella sp. TOML190 TaxID=2931351 RepID=UPI00203A6D11|nr:C40 family peptidase [Kangiella sp. TOML190]
MNLLLSITRLLLVFSFAAFLAACSSGSRQALSERQYNPEKAQKIVSLAKRMIGMPYRYGGSSPLEGFDCSGLVQFTHSQVSNGIPRVSKQQYQQSATVSLTDLKAGDLLFYRTGSTPTHVTIYIGNRQFIHAPSSGKKVMIASMDNPYFKKRLVKAGRLY